MNWEKLKTQECPYCESGKLELHIDECLFRCNTCHFRITMEKYQQVLKHRASPDAEHKEIMWQELHKGRCPLCTSLLSPGVTRFELYKCINPECDFKIRENRLTQILMDEKHPANLFNKKQNEDNK